MPDATQHDIVAAALLRLTDCTLATVEDLVDRSRPPVGETNRQIDIAQQGVDAIMRAGIPHKSACRIEEIIRLSGGKVAQHYGWTKK